MSKSPQDGFGFTDAPLRQRFESNQSNDSADLIGEEQYALESLTQGKLKEAEEIYRKLIKIGTTNHVVYGNLAAICGMQNRFDELVELINKALELEPNYPEAHNYLGNALKQKGELMAAIDSYKIALKLNPNYPDAHNNLGVALRDRGEIISAIVSYKKALSVKPGYPNAFNNLGIALKDQGDLMGAISSYKSALRLKPNSPDVHNNLGIALQGNGDLLAAIASYKTALKLKPDYSNAQNNLGSALQEQGDLMAAIESYRKALSLKPNYSEALNNLGTALQEQGDLAAAISSYKEALNLKSSNSDALNNLGTALQEHGEVAEAIASYLAAIKLKPIHPDAFNNLGSAYYEQGKLKEAINSYQNAINLRPNYPEAYLNYALVSLLVGNYKDGWEQYEWRLKAKKTALKNSVSPKCERWNGESLPQSGKLLLVAEQGLGDTLQFMRYAHVLKDQGIDLSFCAQPKLHRLIQSSGIDPSPLTPEQANKVDEGQWMPLLSVPRHLGVSPTNVIATDPYIKATNKLVEKWSNLLSSEGRPIIGINWHGNRQDNSRKSRNIPLEHILKLTSSLNATVISLQKDGQRLITRQTCTTRKLLELQEEISRIADSDDSEDFLEYISIVANCHLVITTGTTVAHISAGMGIPTWVLLQKIPDWRWGLEGEKSFWYPSVRLFRQQDMGNWSQLIKQVKKELEQRLGKY